MGEVYRARDTKLNRDVAIKVLPESVAADPDRLARFEREAQTLAALNHPNIAHVHELAESTGVRAFVMELVEGEDLAQRLARGPMSSREALPLARQIAEGLDAAHQRGIIHRDLKPANIKVTPDGVAKLLDFGLAKAVEQARGSDGLLTLTSPGQTRAGVILGTVAYMSPEQARGQTVDKRTDIWAFGCVLYEMLTGRLAFGRASVSDVIAAILDREPEWEHLPAATPPAARRVIHRCLEKDARRRLRDIGDAIVDLDEALRPPEPPAGNGAAKASRRRSWPIRALGAAAAVALAALTMWAGRTLSHQAAPAPQGSSITSMTPLTTDPGYEGEPTFSPDGSTLAYVTDRFGNFEIVRRQVSGGAEVNLTNNGADDVQPAFSPDGQSMAFVSSRGRPRRLKHEGYDLPLMGGSIWVMSALGGAARRVVEEGGFPSWSPDGSFILYSTGPAFSQKLLIVPAVGGPSKEVPVAFTGSPVRFIVHPRYSADGRWIVFEGDSAVGFGPRDIYLIGAAGGTPQHIAAGQHPTWHPDSGAIVFSNGAPGANFSLWEVSISRDDGRPAGPARPLTVCRGRDTQPAISRDGRLMAFAGVDFSFNAEAMPFDAETGRALGSPVPLTRGGWVTYFQSFSPDGRSIVCERRVGTGSHLWRVDRDGVPTQLTVDPAFEDAHPRWHPHDNLIAFRRRLLAGSPTATEIWAIAGDGSHPRQLIPEAGLFTWLGSGKGLVYFSIRDRQLYLYAMGDGSSRKLTDEPAIVPVLSVSADDQWLVYQSTASGNSDLRALSLSGGAARTILATPDHEYHPVISPSGRWLYFQRNHENFYRVPGPAQGFRAASPEQVTHFPESGLLLDDPQLSGDGRQLLYTRGRRVSDTWLATLAR
jgi:serine/threonine protein kinase